MPKYKYEGSEEVIFTTLNIEVKPDDEIDYDGEINNKDVVEIEDDEEEE